MSLFSSLQFPITQQSKSSAEAPILSSKMIQDLINSVGQKEKLNSEIETLIMELANKFVKEIIEMSCALAKHRGSNEITVKDVELPLKKIWDIEVPGFISSKTHIQIKQSS